MRAKNNDLKAQARVSIGGYISATRSSVPKGIYIIAAGALIFLSGCATHSVGQIMDPPGFFHGLFHGFVMLFSFIGSFFTDYEVYAFPNAGTWYDLGFLLGASIFFGGGGAGSRRK